MTIKRNTAGRLWLYFSVVQMIQEEASTDQNGGFDFGLKHFLTNDEGQRIDMPQLYRDDLTLLYSMQRQVSKKTEDSTNQQKGRHNLTRRHRRIDDKRHDVYFKLAHNLYEKCDVLCFEDLNIGGICPIHENPVMAARLNTAFKRGKWIAKIDHWAPTAQIHPGCGSMSLTYVK